MNTDRDIDDQNLNDLQRFKSRLQFTAFVVASLDLALIVNTAILSLLCLIPNLAEFFFGLNSRQSTVAISTILLGVSSIITVMVVVWLFSFERTAKSAQILSAVFADEVGWYSEYSTKSRSKPDRLTRSAGPADTIRARSILREIAENSHLPFVESEIGTTVYAVIALASMFWQALLFYLIFKRGL
jgi:hypothetical protein